MSAASTSRPARRCGRAPRQHGADRADAAGARRSPPRRPGGADPGGDHAPLEPAHARTRWAYPPSAAPVRSSPSPRARAVGRLRFLTVDDQAELYVALASARKPARRILDADRGTRAAQRTHRLGAARRARDAARSCTSYLRVDQRDADARRLYRERAGRVFKRASASARRATVTPTGHFYVLEKLRPVGTDALRALRARHERLRPDARRMARRRRRRHPRHERTAARCPGTSSHGCVRLRDGDIARLWHMVGLGTPIDIV